MSEYSQKESIARIRVEAARDLADGSIASFSARSGRSEKRKPPCWSCKIISRHEIKPAPRRHPEILEWPKLIAKVGNADKTEKGSSMDKQIAPRRGEAVGRIQMNAGPGWKDLELLLRALAEIHARPLILSMPIDGRFYDQIGVSRSARESYYQKIRAMAQRYNFAVSNLSSTTKTRLFSTVTCNTSRAGT